MVEFIESYGVLYNEPSKAITGVSDQFQKNMKLPKNFKEFSDILTIGYAAFISKPIESIDLSDTVITQISRNAFCYCDKLSSIILPKTLEIIGGNAFALTGLTEVTIPESTRYMTGYSFNQNSNLDILKVDSKNKYFKDVDNFIFNYELTQIIRSPIHFEFDEIPFLNTLTGIGERALGGSKITRFIASPNITYLHQDCFHACLSLFFIDLSKANICVIPARLFAQMSTENNYKTIILPTATQKIEAGVFNANFLRTLVIHSNTIQIDSGAFDEIGPKTIIFVLTTSKCFENENIFSKTSSSRVTIHASEYYQGSTFGGIRVIKDASTTLAKCVLNPLTLQFKRNFNHISIQCVVFLMY